MSRPEDQLKRAGQGDWEACPFTVEQLTEAALVWKGQTKGLKKGWLCWNVDSDWCYVQQLLAESVGWTPIVGYDPRVGAPHHLSPNAIVIDFNQTLLLPIHYPHIPIELAFCWIEKLAFWHADFLARPPLLEKLGRAFDLLKNGETAAVPTRTLKTLLKPRRERYWELIGCTTAQASRSQFENGCGWWMNFWKHPNFRGPSNTSSLFNWDHGGGIRYWELTRLGEVLEIPLRWVEEGHFSVINNPGYKRATTQSEHYHRNLGDELSENYQLAGCCKQLGIDLESLAPKV